MADPVRDTSTSTSGSAVSSLTWEHICTGTNLILLVFASKRDWQNAVSGVTYDDVAMTKITNASSGHRSDMYGDWYYLVGPATGAHNIVITYAGAVTNAVGIGISYTGASQTGIPDANVDGDNNTASATLDITTVADNAYIVCASMASENWGSAADSPLTQLYDTVVGNYGVTIGDYQKTTAGVQTLSFSCGAFRNWVNAYVSIAPVAGAAGQSPRSMHQFRMRRNK